MIHQKVVTLIQFACCKCQYTCKVEKLTIFNVFFFVYKKAKPRKIKVDK